jgi:hypothetical protein
MQALFSTLLLALAWLGRAGDDQDDDDRRAQRQRDEQVALRVLHHGLGRVPRPGRSKSDLLRVRVRVGVRVRLSVSVGVPRPARSGVVNRYLITARSTIEHWMAWVLVRWRERTNEHWSSRASIAPGAKSIRAAEGGGALLVPDKEIDFWSR